jgi:two-component system CitB family response regulator
MSLQVLVVDDDYRVARLHAATVEGVPGFQVADVSSSLAEAVRHLTVSGTRIDLLVLDLYLPDGSGLDLMRRVDCDVFVVTAAAEAATVRAALSRGALAYLIKPFPEEMLAERLTAYARYRAVTDRLEVVGQAEVDLALRTLHAPSANRPKGHSALTEQAVVKAVVSASEPISAAVVADQVGISRATAQRYLSLLSDGGHIVMQLRYGATGRPEHRFSGPE